MPPLYVVAAEYDPLRGDSEELVEKLKAVGTPVEFRLWPRMTHACLNLAGWVEAVRPEIDRMGEFLRRAEMSARDAAARTEPADAES